LSGRECRERRRKGGCQEKGKRESRHVRAYSTYAEKMGTTPTTLIGEREGGTEKGRKRKEKKKGLNAYLRPCSCGFVAPEKGEGEELPISVVSFFIWEGGGWAREKGRGTRPTNSPDCDGGGWPAGEGSVSMVFFSLLLYYHKREKEWERKKEEGKAQIFFFRLIYR